MDGVAAIATGYAEQIYNITTSEPLNKEELFDLLCEILWNYAEISDKYDMWDAVFKINQGEHDIAYLLTKLFVIDSKWILLMSQGHTYKKQGPSILFLELLLHIIQYISRQEITKPKLDGVIRIVNRSDNSNILNLGIPNDGVLFFKQSSRENPTDIDLALDAINREFDDNNFIRSGNYTLSHVVTSFCRQLLRPPKVKPQRDANFLAKNTVEVNERLYNRFHRLSILADKEQSKLDMAEEQKFRLEKIRLSELEKIRLSEIEARTKEPIVLDTLRQRVDKMKEKVAAVAVAAGASAGASGYKKPCRYGYDCRTDPNFIERNGKPHKYNYYHPEVKPTWKPGGSGKSKRTHRPSSKRPHRTKRHTTRRRTKHRRRH